MPFGTEGVEDAIGIAFSGGGFRATLFHVGSLWRLNELGLLPAIARFSSVSGGSITCGVLAAGWNRLTWRDGVAENFADLVAAPLRAFCRRRIDTPAILKGLLDPFRRPGDYLERCYRDALLGDVSLRQLPDRPRFVFNATNLQTGRSFRFSKPYMGDYRLGLIYDPPLSLSRVVAASSAFPPMLSPVVIDRPGRFEATEGADLNGREEYTRRLLLTDGGVYDNLGLQTVSNRCRKILVSDAGAPFRVADRTGTGWIAQPMRALDIATDQSRGRRKLEMIDDIERGDRYGAYWGIDTRIEDYRLQDSLACRPEKVRPLGRIRTRLNPFSDGEQGMLINWGYALCDAAVRKYAAALLRRPATPPKWPCPAQSLG